MSPTQAMDSPIFCRYFIIVTALLVAGLLGIGIAKAMGRNVTHAWASYRGWLIMVPLLGAILFAGRLAVIIGFTLIAIFAFKEFAKATGLYKDWWMTGVGYLGIIAVGAACGVNDPFQATPGWYGLLMALPAFVTAAVFLVPILRDRSQGQLQMIALAMVGFLYIGWMFGHLTYMANSTHAYGYILYLLVAVELNDVAAFTFGRLFGKHKLRPNISPNKTWEGSIGALGFSMVLPFALRFTFPHFDTWDLLRTGLIVGVGGQVGDLSISLVKRDVGIKDMGTLIRGHGGILDRLDSLIYVAPLFFHATGYRYGMQ